MPYKEIHISTETFASRVTNEAILEWLEARERNRVIGYPDRPPDIDTPMHRMWISHPNEINSFTHAPVNIPQNSFPVYAICYANSLAEAKLLVQFEDNVYTIRRIIRTNQGESLGDFSYSVSEQDVAETFELELELYSQIFYYADFNPIISTYVDFAATEAEIATAYIELEEYFGKYKGRVN